MLNGDIEGTGGRKMVLSHNILTAVPTASFQVTRKMVLSLNIHLTAVPTASFQVTKKITLPWELVIIGDTIVTLVHTV